MPNLRRPRRSWPLPAPFGLVRNHPFLDGNKRIGLIVAFIFLELNGLTVIATEEEAYRVFMDLAAGTLSEEELAVWLERNSGPGSSQATPKK